MGVRAPPYATWEPENSARYYHGKEITHTEPRAYHRTSYRTDYTEKELPPQRQRQQQQRLPENPFVGTTAHRDDYTRKENVRPPSPPLGAPPQSPPAWPVVSYHGECTVSERNLRNSMIEREEERAWRLQAKLVPERVHAFHGEDEKRAVGKGPFSRAGGYPTRARQPAAAAKGPYGVTFTRNATGATDNGPRKEPAPKPRPECKATAAEKAATAAAKPGFSRAAPRRRACRAGTRPRRR